MPLKRLRGTTWKYFDIAPETGYTDTIVVLHGGGIRPEAMFEHILGFAQVFRVVAPWFPEYFSEIDDYVAGLFLIMRHESIKISHFFGLGFGATVAVHFLYRHPARVLSCSLVYCSLPTESKVRTVEKAIRKMDFQNTPMNRILVGASVKGKDIEANIVDLVPGEKDLWVKTIRTFAATKQAINVRLETLLDYHTHFAYTKEDFARWAGKMILIESDDDEYFDPQNFKALKELFPNATPHYFSGCGHLFTLIRGSDVVDNILKIILDEDTYTTLTSKTDNSPRTEEHHVNDLIPVNNHSPPRTPVIQDTSEEDEQNAQQIEHQNAISDNSISDVVKESELKVEASPDKKQQDDKKKKKKKLSNFKESLHESA